MLADAITDHKRATRARSDQPLWLLTIHNNHAVGTFELFCRRLHSTKQGVAVLEFVIHQMRNNFGIGIGDKAVTEPLELLTQRLMVFNDAVVHNRDPL